MDFFILVSVKSHKEKYYVFYSLTWLHFDLN